ncbi:MAG: SPOR domain-containing protein [Thermonemataceae bacterium]|nr:SPOR domain-containing protein [Thermonemataceae bacterium]
MKYLISIYFSLLFSPFFAVGQKNKVYEEDLVPTLPKFTYKKPIFEGNPKIIEIPTTSYVSADDSSWLSKMDITAKLHRIMDYVPENVIVKVKKAGYRVQLYAGTSREEGNRIKGIALNLQKDEETELTFDRPKYKVLSGNFLNREDARELYKFFKRRFPEAAIVPAMVEVVKNATPDELMQLRIQEQEKLLKKKVKN